MAVLSRKDISAFTPPHRMNEETPPVYFVAPMRTYEKSSWNSDLIRTGAGFYTDDQIIAAMKTVVPELDLDNPDEVIGIIDTWQADQKNPKSEPSPEEAALTAETERQYRRIESAMRRMVPEIADMLADRQKWLQNAPKLAAQYALRGWENVPLKFERDRQGKMVERLLDELPAEDVLAIGAEAIRLAFPTKEERKNSESPPQSQSIPEPSPSS
jgi:hypothetical protein